VSNLPKSGRPKILNTNHQKKFKKIVKQGNRKSAEQIKDEFNGKTNLQVSTRTIRRSLHELNFFSRVPAAKHLINEVQRQKRLIHDPPVKERI